MFRAFEPARGGGAPGTGGEGACAGRYALLGPLGQGSTATVHAGIDRARPGAPVLAIKRLLPPPDGDGAAAAALRREGDALRRLRHPSIPRLHEEGVADGLPFLAMTRLPGRGLDVGSGRGMPARAVGALLAGAAEALAHVHAAGLVHGDVAPGNLLHGPDGATRLIDFGAARMARDSALDPCWLRPEDRASWATRAYAAPDVLSGRHADPRDDVFSLAVIAFELLGGGSRRADGWTRPEGIGRGAWRVLRAALSPEREERPHDAPALAAALRGGLRRLVGGAR